MTSVKVEPKKERCPAGGLHAYPNLKGDENRTCLKCGYTKPKGT